MLTWTKSRNPIQSCRPVVVRLCLPGNCRSYWCQWRRRPGQKTESEKFCPIRSCSKRIWRGNRLTSGLMGGVRVPFRKPSQLKPSNHLNTKRAESRFYRQHLNTLFLEFQLVVSLTCASECPWLHFSGFRVSLMDYLCGHKHLQLNTKYLLWEEARA